MFKSEVTIRVHDTDVAGIIYFANIFRVAHTANEEFMDSIGMALHTLINKVEFLLPIIHTNADIKHPIRLGDKLTIELTLGEVRSSSYTLHYRIAGPDGKTRAAVQTVHCAINREKFEKIPLPDQVKEALHQLELLSAK